MPPILAAIEHAPIPIFLRKRKTLHIQDGHDVIHFHIKDFSTHYMPKEYLTTFYMLKRMSDNKLYTRKKVYVTINYIPEEYLTTDSMLKGISISDYMMKENLISDYMLKDYTIYPKEISDCKLRTSSSSFSMEL